MREEKIKLIALDLDGTTLNRQGQLTARTKQALNDAMGRGVHVVIATGRVFSALPEDVMNFAGIEYIMTSNGANVTDMRSGEVLYSNCIDAPAAEETIALLRNYDFMFEFFIKRHAYVEKEIYDRLEEIGLAERHNHYIRSTREPVSGLLDFALANKEYIENININFGNQKDRSMMKEVLGHLRNVTLTSSFDHNLEIGGKTTSKADAVRNLCARLGLTESQVMACGDSPNDLAMLRAAGFPVAMGNAKDELKEIAEYITATNEEDGVAIAIEKFVLE